jgi:uncharacterized OB-fold protein
VSERSERSEPFLPTRPPRRNLETAEFWDGCAAGRFLLPRCDDCGEHIWYPRLLCPFCGSTAVHYHEASGRGTVYSFAVQRRGQGPWRDVAPYVVAMVRLAEGPVVMTNLVDVDPDTVAIDQPVHVVFEPVADSDDALFRFAPDA